MSLDQLAPPGAPAPAPVAAPQAAAVPPPFDAVIAGTVPAVTVGPIQRDVTPDPAQAFVIQNLSDLRSAGLDFYEAADLSTVVYNPSKLDEKALKAADKAGTLPEIAPPATAPAPDTAGAPEGAVPAQGGGLAAVSPALTGPAAAPAPALQSSRLGNVQPPGPGIKPDGIPTRLSRRAL